MDEISRREQDGWTVVEKQAFGRHGWPKTDVEIIGEVDDSRTTITVQAWIAPAIGESFAHEAIIRINANAYGFSPKAMAQWLIGLQIAQGEAERLRDEFEHAATLIGDEERAEHDATLARTRRHHSR